MSGSKGVHFEVRTKTNPARKKPQSLLGPSYSLRFNRPPNDRLRDKPPFPQETPHLHRSQHHLLQIDLYGEKRLDKMRQEQSRKSLQPNRKRKKNNNRHNRHNQRNPRLHKNHTKKPRLHPTKTVNFLMNSAEAQTLHNQKQTQKNITNTPKNNKPNTKLSRTINSSFI
jgi:hypothetical protein